MVETSVQWFEWLPLLSAFTLGLFGGAHCIGMCGGIMAALSFSVADERPSSRHVVVLSYNVGRILSYTLLGALAGLLGLQLAGGHGISAMRILAGILLVSMGLYLADWWRGLTYLERLGGILWRYLQPLGKRLLPVTSVHSALALGALWGWLPCGLVYTALTYSLAQAQMAPAALVMLAFGLGTLPAVVAAGVFAERLQALLQLRQLRITMAILIILFGIWTMIGSLGHALMGHDGQHGGHGTHEAHEDHGTHEAPPGVGTSESMPDANQHDHIHRHHDDQHNHH